MFNPDDLARWSHGRWVGAGPGPVSRICSDTRTLQRGDLYIALRGERCDGHAYVAEAFARGAAAAVVREDMAPGADPGRALLCVADTHRALLDMARGHRLRLGGTVIAVTGSVGKTTVKEMIADVLATAAPTARTHGNWNNDIGLPLSLLAMDPVAAYGVFEIGMNHPGELAALCDVLRPARAVMTPVGPAHLEYFASVEAIAREKASALSSLPGDGIAFLCPDDPWYDLFQGSTPCRIVTVSLQGDRDADYVGRRAADDGGLAVTERVSGDTVTYPMPLPGDYVMQNAMRAIAVGRECGVDPARIASALRGYRPPAMRWSQLTLGGIVFINDAYNANPVSMRAALGAFRQVPCRGRRWLVLGGMRELGQAAESEHLTLGREIAYGDWAGLAAVGELARGIAEGVLGEGWGEDRVMRCADPREAARALKQRVAAGDAVLLKGSRAERVEDVLNEWESPIGNRQSKIEK